MLRVQIIYGKPGLAAMPIIEVQDLGLVRLVFEQAEREFREAVAATDDPVLKSLVLAELEQARRVLQAAGVEVCDVDPSV